MTNLAKTYGDALYTLAQEEKLEEKLLEQLAAVCDLLAQNPEYVRLIESRAVSKAERLKLLDDAFHGRVEPYLLHFMKILCERGAFGQLPACRDAYVREYNESHGIVPAMAVSATPLSAEQQERLARALGEKTGKTIQLTVKVDPSLGGGLRVEMEGMRYDNTVASRMDHLRRALTAQS